MKSSFQSFLLFILFFLKKEACATCPCEGIIIAGIDQDHCWQLENRIEQTWEAGDNACQSIGGHLGHPVRTDMEKILNYVRQKTQLAVLTGIVAGNVETPIFAKMCQENTFYDVINNTDNIFSNDPTSNQTCSFLTSSSVELSFKSCGTSAMVLCDRPLEQSDYCEIMANCSTTSTSTTTETTTYDASTIPSSPTPTTMSTSLFNASTSSITIDEPKSTKNPVPINPTLTTLLSTKLHSTPNITKSPTGNDVVDFDVTTKPPQLVANSPASCINTESCLKHQWKIFGMCIDWRALLALLLIGLLLFCCCCICHYCMHACMWCSPKQKEKNVLDPVLPLQVAPIIANNRPVDYLSEKPDVITLPPQAVAPEPVIVTVPEKYESVYGFHTKEIIHILPDKPSTREIGTMTDFTIEEKKIAPIFVEPVKPKKKVKKPKKMFIPSTITPLEENDEFNDDIGADIPLDIRSNSPDAISIAPIGDSQLNGPFAFSKNPKPLAPEPKSSKLFTNPTLNNDDKPVIAPVADFSDPQRIRSPPTSKNQPNRLSFSPIPDDSDDEVIKSIPSPPKSRKDVAKPSPPRNDAVNSVSREEPETNGNDDNNKPILRNKRINENNSPSEPSQPVQRSPSVNNNQPGNPFARLGGGSSSASANDDATPLPGANPNVGMRAARGKLGGVVKGGGGGGDAPTAWKPWATGKNKQ